LADHVALFLKIYCEDNII